MCESAEGPWAGPGSAPALRSGFLANGLGLDIVLAVLLRQWSGGEEQQTFSESGLDQAPVVLCGKVLEEAVRASLRKHAHINSCSCA